MIELNNKTSQDFLNRYWVKRLLDAGVDMSDAKYCICNHLDSTNLKEDYIYYIDEAKSNDYILSWVPTYTVSELLYKLHEYIYPVIEGKRYSGGLRLIKDAPFYPAYYNLKSDDGIVNNDSFSADGEYPIESLASLLIQCHEKGIGDTGDISSK